MALGWQYKDEQAEFGLFRVGQINGGCGYDWDQFTVYVDRQGVYYWISEGGCSCNGPLEGVSSADDLDGRGTKFEAARQAKDYAGDDEDKKAQAVDLIADIMRPKEN